MIRDEDGTEIATPEEALWSKVKESREATIKNLKEALIIEEAMLEMAVLKLAALGL